MAIGSGRFGWLSLLLLLPALAACGHRFDVPSYRSHDALFGYLGGDGKPPTKRAVCSAWMGTVVARDPYAITHSSFPETNAQGACFVRVRHPSDDEASAEGPPPRGCNFPAEGARARLTSLADALERAALAPVPSSRFFGCSLPPEDVRAAALHNALVLRTVIADPDDSYPYAAIVVPGHGLPEQDASPLTSYRPVPGATCAAISPLDVDALGAMSMRTRRAASLLHGHVAPVAIVTGGAVHSRLVEAFAMLALLTCERGAPFVPVAPDRVIVEPCADHTHTNLRNAGAWIDAMGGRAGYVVTDDFIQSKYFQDESGFEIVGGSIDQRSLRDFGYVIGSWRQASVGNDAGFWFTPYRFWAEPRAGLGSLTCVGE